MRVEVGDQLVWLSRTGARNEIVGVVAAVLDGDDGSPFIVRWYRDDSLSTCDADPARFFVRSHVEGKDIGLALMGRRSVA